MKTKDYIVQLISELSNFMLESDPSRLVISLHQEEDGFHLSVMDNTERSDDEMAMIEKNLNLSSRPELAEYYGAMAGSDLIGRARLNLIGWQIKRADVSRIDKGSKVDLWLGSDRFDSKRFTIKN